MFLSNLAHDIPEIYESDLMNMMVSKAIEMIRDAEDKFCVNYDELLREALYVINPLSVQYVLYQIIIELEELW